MPVHRDPPKGDQWLLTPDWKALVKHRLGEMGRTQMWLSKQLGVDRSAITKMLKSGHTSSLVPTVCEVLGIPPPMQEVRTSDEAAVLRIFRELPEPLRPAVLSILEGMKKASADK